MPAVKALTGDGGAVTCLWDRGRVRRVEHVTLPAGGPLTEEELSCRAVVWKSWKAWHWKCRRCGFGPAHASASWDVSYRQAYIHVKLNWLLEAAAALENELEAGDDCE